jgi:superfamily II DNA or RNA helicase
MNNHPPGNIIDNENRLLVDELKNALPSAESLDIQTGYFFFSGFSELADQLENVKIRVIVGMDIDPQIIEMKKITEDFDLSRARGMEPPATETAKIRNYRESFIALMNNTDLLDNERLDDSLKIFFKKVTDGTLEIRMNINPSHGKYYVLHNKPEHSMNGSFKGLRFMGSSNFSFSGLKGQGEINEVSRDSHTYEEYSSKFERVWNEQTTATVLDKDLVREFINEVKDKSSYFDEPKPYLIYVRILKELFDLSKDSSLKLPSELTEGKFNNFEYQSDAIKQGISTIKTYGGALLADVVGLGKSVIASGIAANLKLRTVVIAPPHLETQWQDYGFEFGFGPKVYTSGKIEKALKENSNYQNMLIIVDEAHRYRNEDTYDYQNLHKLCLNNKVLLLTATPFNNDPKDVFALLRLFDAPSQSRINTVENLSIEFRELIADYKRLRQNIRKLEDSEIEDRTKAIATKIRQLIEPVLIRRSRLDIKQIERYNTDLITQGFEFSEIEPPKLMEYDLGRLNKLYVETLDKINRATNSEGAKEGYTAARYQPTQYINDQNEFKSLMKKYYSDSDDFTQAQINLAKFMRRFLVMRFESSIYAFKSTLDNFIFNHELIMNWWEKFGYVPIYKKGIIPDPLSLESAENLEELNLAFSTNDLESILNSEKLSKDVEKGLILIPKNIMDGNFIEFVKKDIALLKELREAWFVNSEISYDPKLENLINNLKKFNNENSKRKIIIFTAYADTADYLHSALNDHGLRVLKYTGGNSSTINKELVIKNFDAGIPEGEQLDDFDVLVATDAISEGYNLHRAGLIINYDIPYNPVRVVQRIGRINRINKKVFDKLYIYNSFPSPIGEDETKTKLISTLKVDLMNTLMGTDTKVLTDAEKLESHFVDRFNEEVARDELESWDAKYRNLWDKLKYDHILIDKIINIKQRSFLTRKSATQGMLIFGKKGMGAPVFVTNINRDEMQRVSAEEVLQYFAADPDEMPINKSEHFKSNFELGKNKLFKKNRLPENKGRRGESIEVLDLMIQNSGSSEISAHCKDARRIINELDGFPDGTLKRIIELKKYYLKDGDFKGAFDELKEIVPAEYMEAINNRSDDISNEPESLLVAEELE